MAANVGVERIEWAVVATTGGVTGAYPAQDENDARTVLRLWRSQKYKPYLEIRRVVEYAWERVK